VKLVAFVVPNLTPVTVQPKAPVIVTLVPPAVGPDVGLTPVTEGTQPMYGSDGRLVPKAFVAVTVKV
jgi:hypothetical protein